MSDISKQDVIPIEWTGEKLRDMRRKIGVTLEEVADVLGYSPSGLSWIERGKTMNTLVMLGYGSVLENWYACDKGYIPAYRKIGTNEFEEMI